MQQEAFANMDQAGMNLGVRGTETTTSLTQQAMAWSPGPRVFKNP